MSYLAGRGIADITGEPAECGMLGYGMAHQQSGGIHTRLRSRAFVIVDPTTGNRVVLSVNELPLIFDSVHREVLSRLRRTYGDLYTDQNVVLTATHTHCGPGGYSHHRLYNSNTGGFRPQTFAAIVEGIVEAVTRAHEDLTPAELTLGHGVLHDASSNRSPQAFARNPDECRNFFPDGIDPQTTVVAIERQDRLVGAINWFPTHCTSMTNRNLLISSDNKGYAAYLWERQVHGVDYLDSVAPSFIGAFAQTNAGDMSPNLNHRPGSGPTEDEFENTRIIGERQFAAAAAALAGAVPLTGPIDARITYVDLTCQEVRPEYAGDGQAHRTGPGWGGAASLAGTDEGPAFKRFNQGRNPVWDGLSKHFLYRLSARLRDAQAPKGLVVPGGLINRFLPLAQQKVPVQLLRLGSLYLVTVPGEPTIAAGLRLRRTVAGVVGAAVKDILVMGYSNAYIHYVTTPEEYDVQRYEGGSTLFGRWELPALQQVTADLAEAMRDGRPAGRGSPPPPIRLPRSARTHIGPDRAAAGRALGDVLLQPKPAYHPGQQVSVVVAGAYPNNDLRRGGTYLQVEHRGDDGWQRVADDGDWSTKLRWARVAPDVSEITVSWDIPVLIQPGRYRVCYFGNARGGGGETRPIDAVTEEFEVLAGDLAV